MALDFLSFGNYTVWLHRLFRYRQYRTELAPYSGAMGYGVPAAVDNGMYGTIRMHQERHYPARVSGTDLVNPDFAALARAYGARGETVLRTEEFAPAFERAVAAGRAALLHVKIDPRALTMGASLDAIRAQAQVASRRP